MSDDEITVEFLNYIVVGLLLLDVQEAVATGNIMCHPYVFYYFCHFFANANVDVDAEKGLSTPNKSCRAQRRVSRGGFIILVIRQKRKIKDKRIIKER
jgi:hypothetical protein